MMFVGESRRAYRCIIPPRRGAECILYTDSSRVPLAFLPLLFCTHPARATDFFGCKYLSRARPRALSGQFNIANADGGELIVVEMRDDADASRWES